MTMIGGMTVDATETIETGTETAQEILGATGQCMKRLRHLKPAEGQLGVGSSSVVGVIAANLPLRKWSDIFHLEATDVVKTMVLRDVHDPMVAVVATMMTTITDPAGKTEDVRSLMLIYVYIIDRQ